MEETEPDPLPMKDDLNFHIKHEILDDSLDTEQVENSSIKNETNEFIKIEQNNTTNSSIFHPALDEYLKVEIKQEVPDDPLDISIKNEIPDINQECYDYEVHSGKLNDLTINIFKCQYCEEIFNHEQVLGIHIKNFHKEKIVKSPTISLLKPRKFILIY